MKLREFIGVFEQSERLRIVKDGNKAQGMEKTGIDAAYEAGRNAGIFLFRFANDTIQHHLYLGRKGRHYDFKGNTKF